jgi:hypothetical protein
MPFWKNFVKNFGFPSAPQIIPQIQHESKSIRIVGGKADSIKKSRCELRPRPYGNTTIGELYFEASGVFVW